MPAFDSSYFCGSFKDNGTQSYLVFQPVYKYFKTSANTKNVTVRKSKGLSDRVLNLHQRLIIVLIKEYIILVMLKFELNFKVVV